MNSNKYDITKIYIKSDKIKKNTIIAHISDLHNSNFSEILDIIKAKKPDFIAVSGDFSNRYTRSWDKGLDFLTKAAMNFPVFLSLGNHEVSFFNESDMEKIKKSGAVLLDNEFLTFGDFSVGGLTSNKDFSNFAFFNSFSGEKNQFRLLLCHHPEYYNMFLKHYDFDLILSGHAHGGQIRIPFIGGVFSPGQGLFPKITNGIHFEKLVISRGLGNPNKCPRWFNKPEIVFIEIETYNTI